jgi:subtilisin family serine protease
LPSRLLTSLSLLVLLSACSGGGPVSPFSSGGATVLQISPQVLSFPGTSQATLTLQANGPWKAETSSSWLTVSPSSGTGNATLTVSVNRSGLTPGDYAGTLLIQGGSACPSSGTACAAIPVYMRFPTLTGNITGPPGQIQAGSLTYHTAPYVPNEVLVKLAPLPGVNLKSTQAVITQAQQVAQSYGLAFRHPIAPNFPWVLMGTRGQPVATVLAALRRDGRVAAAQPNYLLRAQQIIPNNPYYAYQWDLQALDMPDAWSLTTGTPHVVVAVVDSGVQPHPDLNANILYQDAYDFITDNYQGQDLGQVGHGTLVAGIIGAVGNSGQGIAGMNWSVGILPVVVLGQGGTGPASAIAEGIIYAAGFPVYNDAGNLVVPKVTANVINLSLGSTTPDPILEDAIAEAANNDVVVVAASGNDGTNCTDPPSFDAATSPSPVDYPAAYPESIAVGSVDLNYQTGSTYSFAASCFSNGGPQLFVSAPGGFLFNQGTYTPIPQGIIDEGNWGALGIVSTYWIWSGGANQPGYASEVGTSMATPHVAGLAALLLSVNPQLTPALVKLILEQTAEQATGGFNDFLGYGLIQPVPALQEAEKLLTAYNSDFFVRLLSQNGSVIAETRVSPSGDFSLPNIPAGTYLLEAGTDPYHDGNLGEPGSFYGSAQVQVTYSGDLNVNLNVQPK